MFQISFLHIEVDRQAIKSIVCTIFQYRACCEVDYTPVHEIIKI